MVDRSMSSLQTTANTLTSTEQERVLLVEADVSDEVRNTLQWLNRARRLTLPVFHKPATKRYVQATTDRFGQIDISAQIAGVSQRQSPIEDLDQDEFDRVLRVNVKGRKYVFRVRDHFRSGLTSLCSFSWG